MKRQADEIAHEKTWILSRKGNIKIEIESFIIVIQNNANYIKAKIDISQLNSECRLCGKRDETVYQIIRECSKL